MAKPAHVYWLESYDLTLAGLTRLGSRSLEETLVRQLTRLRRAFPEATLTPRNRRKPWTIDATLPARTVAPLSAAPSVAKVFINTIDGRVARPAKRTLRWYCVWGIVAIQVEGQTSGMISLEDRLVTVRAYDAEDATRRLMPVWRDYAEPYLNPSGFLVRWQLVEIQDVYDTSDEAIDPRGTEVFARLRRVRMKPEYRWSPRRRTRRPAATS